jgi:hypothetical protein
MTVAVHTRKTGGSIRQHPIDRCAKKNNPGLVLEKITRGMSPISV